MMTILATIITLIGIATLFHLDRDRRSRKSLVLWIPTLWLLVISARPISSFLGLSHGMSRQQIYNEGSPLDAAIFGILITLGLWIVLGKAVRVQQFATENWTLFLYLAYCALSIVWSDDSFISLKRWIKEAGQVVIVMVVLFDDMPIDALKRIFAHAAYILLPLSLLMAKYYPSLGRGFSPMGFPSWQGVAMQKNGLGLICLFSGLAMLWAMLETWKERSSTLRRNKMIAYGTALALAVYLCLAADSMTSFSCLVMGGTVMILSSRPFFLKRPYAVLMVIAGFCMLAIVGVFIDTSGIFVHALGRNQSLTGRTDIWNAVLAQHTNPLIGAGYYDFWMGSRLANVDKAVGDIQEAHNGYLEIYLNLGWIGIILLLGVIVAGFRHAISLYKTSPKIARFQLSLLTSVVLYGVSEAGFRSPGMSSMCLFIAVCMTPRCFVERVRTNADANGKNRHGMSHSHLHNSPIAGKRVGESSYIRIQTPAHEANLNGLPDGGFMRVSEVDGMKAATYR